MSMTTDKREIMKYRNDSGQTHDTLYYTETLRHRLAALPFPLIGLIILLMGIAKYFG